MADVIDLQETKRIVNDGVDISFKPALVEPSYAPLVQESIARSISKYTAQPIDLTWRDLSFSVPLKGRAKKTAAGKTETSKQILSNISGSVRSGQMLAVMGSSGAGKTSLLNLLAGRVTTSKGAKALGSVMVNAEPRDYATFRKQSAYVLQDDDMFAELTVHEQVSYAATLRLPSAMSARAKAARVDRVIQELGLAKVANSPIGGALVRGVSGGERKRVSIATELVTDPALLFLDEPTTGLDSFNALNVMQALRHLASSGRTIVCTIHQPRSAIFALFDQLLLLSEGRVMYQGAASEAVPYFSSLGFQAPPRFNPADFFIDLLSVDPRSPDKERTTKARIAFMDNKFTAAQQPLLESTPLDDAEAAMEAQVETNEEVPLASGLYQNSWFKELVVLSGRNLKLVSRAKMANGTLLGQTLVFGLLLGIIWMNKGRTDGFESLMSIAGILFFITINQSFGAAFGVIFQFPLERSVVTRERASNMYRTSAYFISKTVTDMAKTFFFNMLFSLLVYWMVGLRRDAVSFFRFTLVLFCLSTFAESLSLAVSVLTGDPQASASLVPVFVVLCVLFGGFFIQSSQLPYWIGWFRYVSFIYYGFNALANIQFPQDSTDIAVMRIREQSDLNNFSYGESIGVMIGLILVIKILGYLFLKFLRGPKFLKF